MDRRSFLKATVGALAGILTIPYLPEIRHVPTEVKPEANPQWTAGEDLSAGDPVVFKDSMQALFSV